MQLLLLSESMPESLEAMTEPKEQQPGAESLKPCPFCNSQNIVKQIDDDGTQHMSCLLCGCSGPFYFEGNRSDVLYWNNAWAHRRIAELEQLNKMRIDCSTLDDQKISTLLEKNADLERQLKEAKSVDDQYSVIAEKFVEITKRLEQQLKEYRDDRYRWLAKAYPKEVKQQVRELKGEK